jgi:integrase
MGTVGSRPRLLGHSSVACTQSMYQHADDEMVDLAAARLAEAFGASSPGS